VRAESAQLETNVYRWQSCDSGIRPWMSLAYVARESKVGLYLKLAPGGGDQLDKGVGTSCNDVDLLPTTSLQESPWAS